MYAAGVVATLAGATKGFQDGARSEARFNEPGGIAVDARGNVYVADEGNRRCVHRPLQTPDNYY